MKKIPWLRTLVAYYFVLACLLWLLFGVLTLIYGEVQPSGDIESFGDLLFALLAWILPSLLGLYIVFFQGLHRWPKKADPTNGD